MKTSIPHTLACAVALALVAAPALADDTPKSTKAHSTQAVNKDVDRTNNHVDRPDAWVLAKLKTKFAASDIVDASDINIDVNNGTATLRGTVDSQRELDEAKRLAKETEGVHKVDTSGLRFDRND